LIRVATFNVENLFARFRFGNRVDPFAAMKDGWNADDTLFSIGDEVQKRLSAQVIDALDADVLGLQEVESLDTLKRFRDRFLRGGRAGYPHAVVIDGNDRRLIDVALLSRHPIVHLRSYQHLWDDEDDEPLFSRDCLEADVLIEGHGLLTVYVNHFKSMRADEGSDPCRGREGSRAKRYRQASAVRSLIEDRFGTTPGDAPFLVMGDFNDYAGDDAQGRSGVGPLVAWDQVENVVDRLPERDRWTHFWRGDRRCKLPFAYRQLDYLLLSRRLARAAPHPPRLERRGQPLRARDYEGPRFDGVGLDRPKASDHCPVLIEIQPW
jgi:predicted extracellular nuclease